MYGTRGIEGVRDMAYWLYESDEYMRGDYLYTPGDTYKANSLNGARAKAAKMSKKATYEIAIAKAPSEYEAWRSKNVSGFVIYDDAKKKAVWCPKGSRNEYVIRSDGSIIKG